MIDLLQSVTEGKGGPVSDWYRFEVMLRLDSSVFDEAGMFKDPPNILDVAAALASVIPGMTHADMLSVKRVPPS